MDDPSGVQAALAIEAVEWEAAPGQTLMIRVRGRWRRRRPALRGQPMLVIEADGQRHRFAAIPEPPSLAGAPPGSWQMSFSVPSWLAPALSGRSWLQLGVAMIPLPPPSGPLASASDAPAPDAEILADRRVRTAEITAQRERDRRAEAEAMVADLTARIDTLEQELAQMRRQAEELRDHAAERERSRRAAEQREHAEVAVRIELEEEVARRAADEESLRTALGELAAAEERIRRLEAERDRLLADADTLERTAAAPELGPEVELANRLAPAKGPALRPVRAPAPAELRALERERALVRRHQRARAAPGTSQPAGPPGAIVAVLRELRAEFDGLREIVECERGARDAAQARVAELQRELDDEGMRSARVYEALADLRGLLEVVRHDVEQERETAAEEPPRVPVEPVERSVEADQVARNIDAERLDAARARLRETVHPPEPAEEAAAERSLKAWLEPAFRRLLAYEPEIAGQVLIGLLPAQGLAHPAPIAYDLRLASDEYVHVTVVADPPATEVVHARAPRPRAQRSFWVEGDLGALARTVEAGPLRRRLGRRMARIEGSRSGFAALRAIIGLHRGLDQLVDAGVRLDPELAFALAASMIDPRWTAEDRFSIAHSAGGESAPTRPTTYLHVRRGERPAFTTTPPLWEVAATVVCADELLLGVLAGRRGAGVMIEGDETALATVISWLDHAQRR